MVSAGHDVPLTAIETRPDPRRIVVIGRCASGKTSLVSGLRERGYDAHASGQEHSEISDLWRRLAPDVLVALTIDLVTVRARRYQNWPEWLFETQTRRLARAMAEADLVIDTATNDVPTTIGLVVAYLEQHPPP